VRELATPGNRGGSERQDPMVRKSSEAAVTEYERWWQRWLQLRWLRRRPGGELQTRGKGRWRGVARVQFEMGGAVQGRNF
jgi:hypothetical protein